MLTLPRRFNPDGCHTESVAASMRRSRPDNSGSIPAGFRLMADVNSLTMYKSVFGGCCVFLNSSNLARISSRFRESSVVVRWAMMCSNRDIGRRSSAFFRRTSSMATSTTKNEERNETPERTVDR